MKHIHLKEVDLELFLAAYGQPKHAEEGALIHPSGFPPELGKWLECFNARWGEGDVCKPFFVGLGDNVGRCNPAKFRHVLNRVGNALPRVLRGLVGWIGFGHAKKPTENKKEAQ